MALVRLAAILWNSARACRWRVTCAGIVDTSRPKRLTGAAYRSSIPPACVRARVPISIGLEFGLVATASGMTFRHLVDDLEPLAIVFGSGSSAPRPW